ncbi:MAG: methyltransferase domain-containing protein [Cytophagales bacterium]|nr:MAG: methyltransferase domain-containing protein [Cytophagales bacterium]
MFRKRSYQKELLDNLEIPRLDLYQNLKELEFINKWLGGHDISIQGIKTIINKLPKDKINLLDIGCGGGDNLRAIRKIFEKDKSILNLNGADLNTNCIQYAIEKSKAYPEINYFCDDFRNVLYTNPYIIHAALFFHHFHDSEISGFLSQAKAHHCFIIINDLERNPIAYYAIKLLTKIFSKSYLVKNDAPLSVLRGFKKKEWKEILYKAGIKNYTIKNKWAFRHLILIYPNER